MRVWGQCIKFVYPKWLGNHLCWTETKIRWRSPSPGSVVALVVATSGALRFGRDQHQESRLMQEACVLRVLLFIKQLCLGTCQNTCVFLSRTDFVFPVSEIKVLFLCEKYKPVKESIQKKIWFLSFVPWFILSLALYYWLLFPVVRMVFLLLYFSLVPPVRNSYL